eukprot:1136471-Pelagomonas_calceolata.AAC.8
MRVQGKNAQSFAAGLLFSVAAPFFPAARIVLLPNGRGVGDQEAHGEVWRRGAHRHEGAGLSLESTTSRHGWENV